MLTAKAQKYDHGGFLTEQRVKTTTEIGQHRDSASITRVSVVIMT